MSALASEFGPECSYIRHSIRVFASVFGLLSIYLYRCWPVNVAIQLILVLLSIVTVPNLNKLGINLAVVLPV
jgi:hypothetical protein